MPMGLQVFNASGNLTFNSGDFLPRFVGSFYTGTSNGSITDGNLSSSTNTPFFIYQQVTPSGQNPGVPPAVSISGTTISWSFPSGYDGSYSNGYVLYGLW